MTVAPLFAGRLTLPVIAAPMFLVSTPPLVQALCQAGVVGTLPHQNARTSALLDSWLTGIAAALSAHDARRPHCPAAPYGVNLVVHPSNSRWKEDLQVIRRHRVPLVITSLGHPGAVAETVHAYGGLVFADVTQCRHARRAIEAGVDGLICIAGGAGGHTGSTSPFALVREIRSLWAGCLVLGGAIADGMQVRAAELMGADLAYIGTRFIATRESAAAESYKQMLVDCGTQDLVLTDRFSGIAANYLRPSIERYGFDPGQLPDKAFSHDGQLQDRRPGVSQPKPWRDLWSAGHGIAAIDDIPPVGELIERMRREYATACALPTSAALRTLPALTEPGAHS